MNPQKIKMMALLAVLIAVFVGRLFPFWSVTNFLRITSFREDSFSKSFLSLLETGGVNRAVEFVNPRMRVGSEKSLSQLKQGLDRFGNFQAFYLIRVNYLNASDSAEKIRQLIYYVDLEKGSALFQVALQKDGKGGFWVDQCQYNSVAQPFWEVTRFEFRGKTLVQYLCFFGMVLMGPFIFGTLALCFRSDIKLKWFWALFILIGFGKLGISWSSPSLTFQPFAFQIFSSGLVKNSLTEPWMVSISFPLGAVLFYFFGKRKRQAVTAGE